MTKLELIAIGTGTRVVLPRDRLARLRVEPSDSLAVVETPEGFLLLPCDLAVEAQLKAGRDFMKEYQDTFKDLAK